MIVGIGVDLVKVARIRAAMDRWGDRFLARVFTDRERAYAQRRREPALHFAGRFAVKEAALKALGIGLRLGVRWREIEVANDASGKPGLSFAGRTKAISDARGVGRTPLTSHVSISHEADYAIGQVILSAPSPTPR